MMQRDTVQRRAIRQVFLDSDRPMGPLEVLGEARFISPTIGVATVYRTIKGLVEESWLTPVDLPGEAARYEVSGKGHHHHFHCRACGRAYELQGCPGNLKRMVPNGFEMDDHEVVLYGRCQTCVTAA
jgi:Fur family transcriptional regulator, ferric uptake regulator